MEKKNNFIWVIVFAYFLSLSLPLSIFHFLSLTLFAPSLTHSQMQSISGFRYRKFFLLIMAIFFMHAQLQWALGQQNRKRKQQVKSWSNRWTKQKQQYYLLSSTENKNKS